ncbi:FHA domain-containing protein [Streptomyces gilvifuscus]|uniref:FHA domain-containing protein n=1 Tax=Streptomyces gilvifuscus TaxID=1550617 RepID=A0ABT5FZ26_9ACTN|nr:FHA domain-containing protein [Streptomyces gilvifuscus]MDC2957677.1 FHA domain-containing protein [Streptomyces gilvifuscus]
MPEDVVPPSPREPSEPRLILATGRDPGRAFPIPDGYCEIGRVTGTAIRIDDDGVSRRHASLSRTGDRISVHDLGSTNGTYVNGRRLDNAPSGPLHDGDRLRVGSVELWLSCPATGDSGARMGFHDVHGPVNAGEGRQYVAGRDQFVAGRDLYGDDHRVIVNADYDPGDEFFQGQGFGRLLMIVGTVVALVGFALFVSVIFAGAGASPEDNAFVDVRTFGMPRVVVGFSAFAIGGVLAGIGQGLSKAARKRHEETVDLHRPRRPGR